MCLSWCKLLLEPLPKANLLVLPDVIISHKAIKQKSKTPFLYLNG